MTMLAEPLSQERLKDRIHYDPVTGVFTRAKDYSVQGNHFKAGCIATTSTKQGGHSGKRRLMVTVYKKRYYARRLAWFYVHGVWPKNSIDHIDGDPSNNSISNLREATQAENLQNKRAPAKAKSGLLGVCFCNDGHINKWQARIQVSGKTVRLGHFPTPEEASAAYLAAKIKLHPFQTIAKGTP
jgi:hypothetical protein